MAFNTCFKYLRFTLSYALKKSKDRIAPDDPDEFTPSIILIKFIAEVQIF